MKPTYEPVIFENLLESIRPEDHIIATYYFEQEGVMDHLQVVGFMSLETSTGGWIDFPGETPEVRQKLAAKVVGFYPVPVPEGKKGAIVQLAFPTNGTAGYGGNIPMLLTAIAGNILAMPGTVRLEDVWLPESFTKRFPGPRFGVQGMRELIGVPDRPWVNMMVKPKVGLPPEEIGRVCYEAAMGGCDHIKDDEMAADVFNCTFEDRLREVIKGLNRAEAECGKKVLYTINVSDRGTKLQEKAKRAVAAGANALMVNFWAGFEALATLAEDPDINVPILFHPSGSEGILSVSKAVWAKLARVCGADLYLPGSPWAKWARMEELERSVRGKNALQAAFNGIKPSFVLQSSVAGKVATFVADYGKDVILGGGAAVHGHPQGTRGGVVAIRQAIDAVMQGVSAEEYGKEHLELRQALDRFGTFQRPQEKRY